MKLTYSVCAIAFCGLFVLNFALAQPASTRAEFADPSEVTAVNGVLGEALASARKGRLTSLPTWKEGELITMFSKEAKATHDKTDWYGEHGGKWLFSAAIAVRQGHDKQLEALLLKTADYLVTQQDADGYLGVYSPSIRLTSTTASHKRSWDVWNLSYMTLGLLKTYQYYPKPEYLKAAKNIGELFLTTFGDGRNIITNYGTRHGASATVLLDPVVELYKITKDKRYLDFAQLILKEMEDTEGMKLLSVPLNNGDMENVADGKAYQLLWNLTGLAKLYKETGNADYLTAVRNAWQNVADYHLTITGGPWGGIGKHLECFNKKNFWSPYGFVETCSTMSWIQLNKELLSLTGDAKYAQEIEKSAYNALLGARFPNGVDWTYHSFNNGSWHLAHFNDCCPSSGTLALEELPSAIYSHRENGIALNLFTDSEANLTLGKGTVKLIQKTQYPFDGKITLTVTPSKSEKFPLFVRIPDWASTGTIKINGKPEVVNIKSGEYARIERSWIKDVVEIEFPMDMKLHQKVEWADIPQGGGEIFKVNWFAMSRGPLVFSANGLIGGTDRERALPVDLTKADAIFSAVGAQKGTPAYELKTAADQKLVFVPYYQAGESKPGQWRLTWLQNKID